MKKEDEVMRRSKKSLKLNMLKVHSLNRSHENELDRGYVDSLAADIEKNSLLHSITLKRDTDDKYLVVAGAHRLEALRKLRGDDGKLKPEEYQLVPSTMTDDDIVRVSIAENAKRHDSTPIQLAGYILRLRSKYGYTQEQIAEYMGCPRQAVAALEKLVERFDELPAMWQRDLREPADKRTVITLTHWTELHSKLHHPISDEVFKLMEQAWRESWSVRKTVRAIEGHLIAKGAEKLCAQRREAKATELAKNQSPEEFLQEEYSATPPDYRAVRDSLADAHVSCGADKKLSTKIVALLNYCEECLLGVA